MTARLRDIPQIETLLNNCAIACLVREFSHAEVVDALRSEIDSCRARIIADEDAALQDFTSDDSIARMAGIIAQGRAPVMRPVVNATGILIHTNLGRARLAQEAQVRMSQSATQAVTLEYDLARGGRGGRGSGAEALVCRLTGAEAALVVNNCAAAVLLGLTALAQGREVIASRGELIEIGGSYRLPDVVAQSGARLREVGATNKTRTSDYADAIGADTAVLLKSHTSNFRIVGFTSAPSRAELVALARARDLVVMEDLGSGILIDLSAYGLADEPVVSDILASGVDVVMFSGDKLLGGPQAGILAGRADVIARLRKHPLFRALRSDKSTLAALEATLRLYLPPHDPLCDVPVLRMLATPVKDLRARAADIIARVGDAIAMDVVESAAHVGAGALPQTDLPSVALLVRDPARGADAVAAALRAAEVPVIGRIHGGFVHLDMRSIDTADVDAIVAGLRGLNP